MSDQLHPQLFRTATLNSHHLRKLIDSEEIFCKKPSQDSEVLSLSPEKFMQEGGRFENLKKSELQKLNETDDLKDFNIFPRLSEKTNKGSTFINTCFRNSICTPLDASFSPLINKKSKKLIREKPVEELLYNDALRRIRQERPIPKPVPIQASQSSKRILLDKLMREVNEALSHSHRIVLEAEFIVLLGSLNMIESSKDIELGHKAWKFLKSNKAASKEKIVDFILCVMKIQTSENFFAGEKATTIHKTFKEFYHNRQNTLKSFAKPQEFSFSPKIMKKSEKLAKKVKRKRLESFGDDSVRCLVHHKDKFQEKIKQLRIEKEENSMKDCTFKPQINNSECSSSDSRYISLFERSKIESPKLMTTEEIKLQESLNECYFTPKILNTVQSLLPKKTVIKNLVDRLSKPKKKHSKKENKKENKRRVAKEKNTNKCSSPTSIAKKLKKNNL